jgi:hypothetical protein
MATEAQIAANRRNCLKSTGPRTPEGKASVSLNSFAHGLYSRRVVLPHQDPAAFQQLCDSVAAEQQPATPAERELVQRIAITLWKLERIREFESRCLMLSVRPPALMERIRRQQSRLRRSHDKAVAGLQRLRKGLAS